MSEHTPTPWCIPAGDKNGFIICTGDDPAKPGPILLVLRTPLGRGSVPTDFDINANAAFIVKAVNAHDKLVEALRMQEDAELAHTNCDECDGEEVPELCPKCFPLFDDARIARRAALETIKDRA